MFAPHRTSTHLARLAVAATLLAALAGAAVLTLTGVPASTAVAAAPVVEPARAAVLPAPAFPELDIPDVPLPTVESASDSTTVAYTCEPWADAEFGDPARPHLITNKDCPELIAAKEKAQREYRDQLDREAAARNEEVGDWRSTLPE